MADRLIVKGAHRAQPAKRRSRPAPRQPDRVHRPVRLGQVLAGVRHHLRRGSAPLRGVAVGLRPAVPRSDGQARRRLHRGSVARRVDRPEVHQSQPRSTVGTITEVYDYLRLLYARAGRAHCPVCGERIARQTPQQIVDQVLAMPEGTRSRCSPRWCGAARRIVDLFDKLNTQGYSRVRVDGVVPADRPAQAEEAGEAQRHRGGGRPADGQGQRQTAAHRLGGDRAGTWPTGSSSSTSSTGRTTTRTASSAFSEKLACPNGHPTPSTIRSRGRFSFNSPYGACPECSGLGIRKEVDPELVVPDPDLTLAEGRWRRGRWATTPNTSRRMMAGLGDTAGLRRGHPVAQASAQGAQRQFWRLRRAVHVSYRNRYGRTRSYYADFEGVMARSCSGGWIEPSRADEGALRGLHA